MHCLGFYAKIGISIQKNWIRKRMMLRESEHHSIQIREPGNYAIQYFIGLGGYSAASALRLMQ
jgi:hypothetical protein